MVSPSFSFTLRVDEQGCKIRIFVNLLKGVMVMFIYCQVAVSLQAAVTGRATWVATAEVAAAEVVVAEDTKKVSSQPQEKHETDL